MESEDSWGIHYLQLELCCMQVELEGQWRTKGSGARRQTDAQKA